MADPAAPAIGRRRWSVKLVNRQQVAQAKGTGIDDVYRDGTLVWADVQPIGAVTFWGAQQTDTPVTHKITLRWADSLDNNTVFLRQTLLPSGQLRTEVFRTRRIKELDGRKRFVEVEVELEKVHSA